MIPFQKHYVIGSIVTSAVIALAAIGSRAHAADGLVVHGSVSATASYSDKYNYLGNTDGKLDLNIVEVVLNGSHRFDNGLRFSAQLYAYKIDDYNDLALDFAALDYSFDEKFGVRFGRFKRPGGLYGDAQDIDIVRPFAFLPFDFYPKTLRPLVAALDGVSLYGTLPLGKGGNLEYQLGWGWLPKVDPASPYVAGVSEGSLNRYSNFESDTSWVASLIWNTPLEGLRFEVTGNDSGDLVLSGPIKTAAELSLSPSDARLTPLAFPPGYYDILLAGKNGTLTGNSMRYTASAEYTRNAWQFAAEYIIVDNDFVATYPAPLGVRASHTKNEAYYVSATWQAQDKLQLGAYYSEGYADKSDHSGSLRLAVPHHTGYLKDTAFAASYGVTSWWLLKGEIHFVNGTRGLTASGNGDAAKWGANWNYFVLKSTVSF